MMLVQYKTWVHIYVRDALIGHMNSFIDWYMNKLEEEQRVSIHDYYSRRVIYEIHPVTALSYLWLALNMCVFIATFKHKLALRLIFTAGANICMWLLALTRVQPATTTYWQVAKGNERLAKQLFPQYDR